MRSSAPRFWSESANHCVVCGGKFGLVRHYAWRRALCSRRCCDRFKAREQGDRVWLSAGGREILVPAQAWSCF